MNRVLILGNSNLAVDLKNIFNRNNWEVKQVSRSLNSLPHLPREKFELVINTIGGQVNDSDDDLYHLNIVNNAWISAFKDIAPCIVFSSNAALEPWRSRFAAIKADMERKFSDKISVIRICNLYGRHFPSRCFPTKLKFNYPKPCTLELPSNFIVPTPTEWLAAQIFTRRSMWKPGLHTIAPSGVTNVYEWGQRILGPNYKVKNGGADETRPVVGFLYDRVINEDWLSLWENFNLSNEMKSSGSMDNGKSCYVQMDLFKQSETDQ